MQSKYTKKSSKFWGTTSTLASIKIAIDFSKAKEIEYGQAQFIHIELVDIVRWTFIWTLVEQWVQIKFLGGGFQLLRGKLVQVLVQHEWQGGGAHFGQGYGHALRQW